MVNICASYDLAVVKFTVFVVNACKFYYAILR